MAVPTETPTRSLAEARQDFPILTRTVHRQRPLVYLDNAASTQHPIPVIEAMSRFYETHYSNVHRGVHTLSQEASEAYEQARLTIAKFIHAQRDKDVVFTAGTTAAINTVARAWGEAFVQAGDEILLTQLEHHSNIVPWQQLAARVGARVRFLPITDAGYLDLETLGDYLSERTRLVALTAVSNVLGTRVPVKAWVEAIRERSSACVLIDAAQHAPHEVLDVQDWDADFVVFSGHKMLGPTGIGILWGKSERLAEMPPFLGGGSMITEVTEAGFEPNEAPAKFEAGTPPIVEAVGLAAAADYLGSIGLEAICDHEQALTNLAYEGLESLPKVRLLGPPGADRAGMVSFVVDGANSQDVCTFLDLKGFATRAGHHCAMPLHQRLGIRSSCRASFYLYNTPEEVERFVAALADVIEKVA